MCQKKDHQSMHDEDNVSIGFEQRFSVKEAQ